MRNECKGNEAEATLYVGLARADLWHDSYFCCPAHPRRVFPTEQIEKNWVLVRAEKEVIPIVESFGCVAFINVLSG